MAFHQATWINDRRHSWSEWTYGHSNLAVDGQHDNIASLNKCAILDNYFVDIPMWMVDLAETHKINGIVMISWPDHYNNQNHIGKLVVSVANVPKIGANETSTYRECGVISIDELKSNSKINVPCQSHLIGQYVYITAYAQENSSHMLFSAILCEVYVY